MKIYFNGTADKRAARAKEDFPQITVMPVKDVVTPQSLSLLESFLDAHLLIELQGSKVIDQTRLLKLCEAKAEFVHISIPALPMLISTLRDRASDKVDLGAYPNFDKLYPIFYGFDLNTMGKDEAIYTLSCLMYLWASDLSVTTMFRRALDDIMFGVPARTVLNTLNITLKGKVAFDTSRRIA